MDKEIIARLNGINQEFYQTFAHSFSQTRFRIQPGVRDVMQMTPKSGDFLDIGCGNGNLAYYWSQEGFSGSFIGVDFSPGLIAAAKQSVHTLQADQSVAFILANLNQDDWCSDLPQKRWQSGFCFAVLHHIPSASLRLRLLRQIRSILPDYSPFWVSVWQPLNSPRLLKRILPWDIVNINPGRVEKGDVLMDWRAHQPEDDQPAVRYVHVFNAAELTMLAEQSGFEVKKVFLSDGREGNLGLYQHWTVRN